ETRAIQQVLIRHQIPADWTGAVFDSNQTVVARSRGPDQFGGQSVSPAFAKALATPREGWTVTHTREGEPVYTAFSRSVTTGWGAALGIPLAVVDAPRHRCLRTIAGSGVALLLVGIGLALLTGRRIVKGLEMVAGAVGALGRREPVHVSPTGLVEVDE